MALQKNIKEVESTEAAFIANAAAKNDGFLTDVTGYPMIKMRGNDYDYWFPEKSRDELGAYTYYDKTVKDLTVLNDCIVQRRLSSYGDADTYLDLSTDDQAVLNVGGVPWLSVVEADGAAVGTLGGNLALGANTISWDGAPNKGFGVGATGIPTVTATAETFGDTRTVLRLYDDTDFTEGDGAGINLYGKTRGIGTYANFGGIKVSKENGVDDDYSASFYIQTRKQGSEPANALRLDSSQNGYITNKLMVGSLTETPENQLSVFKDAKESVFLSVGNSKTGQNGVRIGINEEIGYDNGHAVYDIHYGVHSHSFRSETPTPNVYEAIMKLFWSLEEGGKAWVYGDAQIDGNLQVDGLTASQIVETDANKKLISVAKGTAYNANFGTGSNDVCRGNDSRLSDARVPINNDYYVQGSSSTRTTDAGDTDVNSYSQSGFYRAASDAPNLPTGFVGYGIIHTNHASASNPSAFQLASRWDSNRLYYRRKWSGTWQPWVEIYHSGNFNPADYTTTAQLQDWSTNILANQLGSYNAAEFTTVYNDYCDNIRLIKKELTSLQNGYAGSIAFGARGANTRHAAIAAKQTGSDANQVGLAFFTHAETSISTTYPMVEKMVLDHNGTLSVGASLSSPLALSADATGNATISVPNVNNTITIKSGTTNALVINTNSTSTLQSRSIKLDAWQDVTLGSDGSAFYRIYKITGTFANGSLSGGEYYNKILIPSSGASPIIIGARFMPHPNADGWWMMCSGDTCRLCWYNEKTSKIQFSFQPCQVGDGSIYEIWILES